MYRLMKRLNWQLWSGFVLSLVAGFSYPLLFVRWAGTREFPWANLVLFAVAFVLLFLGLRRAFKSGRGVVPKVFGSLAAAFGVLMLAGLLFVVFVMGAWLPASAGAPRVGQKAPDFTLADTNDRQVTLAQLLSEPVNDRPPRGVLLVFYRGYW